MSINLGKLMGINISIQENKIDNLTIIDPKEKWFFKRKNIKSKSKNTPFINKEFIGRVKGIVVKGEYTKI